MWDVDLKFKRRQVIAGSLGLLASSALAPAKLWANPKLNADPFTLGVAAGDPWPDGFVIWTRLAPDPLAEFGGMPRRAVEVGWEVAEDENFRRIVQSGVHVARPELGHSVHVELAGLQSSRTYFYRFFIAGGESSRVGRAKSAPAAGAKVDRMRIASVGCQHYAHGYFTAFAHLANEPELDVVFHYGDYIYEGASGAEEFRGETGSIGKTVRQHAGGEIYTLDDYRRRYAQYHADPDLQAAHAAAAFVMSFDDHEVDNNWAGDFDQDSTPPELFALRKAMALQAWYENLPVRAAQLPRNGRVQMYRRLDFGDLLRMHVLDTRSYRSKQVCNARNEAYCPPKDDPSRTMLGFGQERWLGEGLSERAAHWNFVAQQIMVMPYDFRTSNGRGDLSKPWSSNDDWVGYEAARQRFIQTIRERQLTNVVIGTGNSHRHIAAHVPLDDRDPTGAAVATEFMSSSISSSGDSDLGWAGLPEMMQYNPHMRLMSLQRGYQIYEATPSQWTTEVKVMDFVGRPGGRISTLARFAVSPHKPRIEEA